MNNSGLRKQLSCNIRFSDKQLLDLARKAAITVKYPIC